MPGCVLRAGLKPTKVKVLIEASRFQPLALAYDWWERVCLKRGKVGALITDYACITTA
jgi:hypothetical protein